jgi:hypothetical protein
MSNYGSNSKNNSGCSAFFILLIIAAFLYTGYRFFADMSLNKGAKAAYQSGDLNIAYKKYDEVDRSFHLFDLGKYRQLAREGVLACAEVENTAAQALQDAGKFEEAFIAFQDLQERGEVFKIGDYASKASDSKLAIFNNMVESVEKAYAGGKCADVAVDGKWVVDHISNLDNGPDISSTQNHLDVCEKYVAEVEGVSGRSPLNAAKSISGFINTNMDDPLVDFAKNKFKALVTVNGYEKIASPEVCEMFPQIYAEWNLKNPDYLYSCGNAYAKAYQTSNAIDLLNTFSETYPTDPRYQQVVDTLADLLIANAQAQGAGSLPEPDKSGKAKKGTSEYEVRNDAPYQLRLVFSGPEKKIVTIPACSTCTEYTIQPMSCPDEGPLDTIILKPGDYSLLVETVTSEGVTPYTGSFTMKDGTQYSSCFYVVKSIF